MEWTVVDEAGLRLDKALSGKKEGFSRTYIQYLIEKGAVLVNGRKERKRTILSAGDTITLEEIPLPEIELTPEEIALDILYEDRDIIAINKPAGMATHPAPGSPSGTIAGALLFHCKSLPDGGDPLRPGIVHRLDKDTTGILIAAKTRRAHIALVEAFAARTVDKQYLAVCVGNPGERTIDTLIGRNPKNRQEMAVLEGSGKRAITRVTPLSWTEEIALVQVALETGRTHQIRVHLKHVNTPVLGDTVYGSRKANARWQVEKQLLHAYRLTLTHPITKEPLSLMAPIPKTFTPFIKTSTGENHG